MLKIAFVYAGILHHQKSGGGGGIRTPETLSSLAVFKTAGFNRSPTPPPMILPHLLDDYGFRRCPIVAHFLFQAFHCRHCIRSGSLYVEGERSADIRVPKDGLYRPSRHADAVQIGRKATTECVPTVPLDIRALERGRMTRVARLSMSVGRPLGPEKMYPALPSRFLCSPRI